MRLLAIDPGHATGMALFGYEEDQPATLIKAWTIPGGVGAFADWCWKSGERSADEWVVETFVLRANDFLANVEGVEVIGFIKGAITHTPVTWQSRADKGGLTGGSGESEAANNAFLKSHKLWQTGKMVGWKDGRDANDAIIHGLVRMKNMRHAPTLREYWG